MIEVDGAAETTTFKGFSEAEIKISVQRYLDLARPTGRSKLWRLAPPWPP